MLKNLITKLLTVLIVKKLNLIHLYSKEYFIIWKENVILQKLNNLLNHLGFKKLNI